MCRELPKGVYERDSGSFQARTWNSGKLETVGTYPDPEEAEYNRLLAMQGHHWEGLPENYQSYFGFLYRITEKDTGRLYIGKKQLYLWAGPQGGYKCTNPMDPEWVPNAWKESDWRVYAGSSAPLSKAMEKRGIWGYKYEVLQMAQDRLILHLMEVGEQTRLDVLNAKDASGKHVYYNENIAGLIFREPYDKKEVYERMQESLREMQLYYLKPAHCVICGSVIPYGKSCCILEMPL